MKVVIADVMIESEPKPEDVRLLEDRIYEFNVQATGTRMASYLPCS